MHFWAVSSSRIYWVIWSDFSLMTCLYQSDDINRWWTCKSLIFKVIQFCMYELRSWAYAYYFEWEALIFFSFIPRVNYFGSKWPNWQTILLPKTKEFEKFPKKPKKTSIESISKWNFCVSFAYSSVNLFCLSLDYVYSIK